MRKEFHLSEGPPFGFSFGDLETPSGRQAIVVLSVEEGSPARAHGILPGCEVLVINGHNVVGMGAVAAKALIVTAGQAPLHLVCNLVRSAPDRALGMSRA